ncbi:hypothetical protein OHA70_15160 [Kribbella sp. NBC_00382]|uniref:hypothetical protein n=1 Tax=Kribbella sp. NBC_00382 TaxID=2975967 RepID=UPI002E1B30DB
MRRQNGLLVALVAAVTVAAVVLGGTIAYRQVPHSANVADAAPLPASITPTTTPSKSTPKPPSVTPTLKPSTPPTSTPPAPTSGPTLTGPTKITLAVSKLPTGRQPQIPYLSGRQVSSGAGGQVDIPGKDDILQVARVNSSVLALTTNGNGSQVLRLDANGVASVANVNHLEAKSDQSGAAYAALGGDGPVEGGTIYADTGTSLTALKLTTRWNFKVLSYVGDKVYFESSNVLGSGATWSTYVWSPGESRPTLVKSLASMTKMAANGQIAATALLINDTGSCSAVTAVDTGLRSWKTCDYYLNDFSPSGATVFGVPSGDDSYCSSAEAALDAKTGKLLREWKGCLQSITPEDDEHLLMVATASGEGDNAKTAIIRCAVSTGDCELATPVGSGRLLLSS